MGLTGQTGATGAVGPAGPQGPTGPQGLPGASGVSAGFTNQIGAPVVSFPVIGPSFVPVTGLALPPGSYIVTAKVVMTNTAAGATSATCQLTQTGNGLLLDRSDGSLPDGNGSVTLVLHTAAVVTGAPDAHVRVACQRNTNGTASVTFQQMTAVQLGSVTTPGP